MTGRWSSSDRKERLPANWTALRLRVLRRDRYECQWREDGVPCRHPANQVDHIERGDDHSLENLQALCQWHHARKSSAEGRAAQRPRASRRRTEERHPGEI
jgi:5-methylcytosine-specific restriction enzyme A